MDAHLSQADDVVLVGQYEHGQHVVGVQHDVTRVQVAQEVGEHPHTTLVLVQLDLLWGSRKEYRLKLDRIK